MVSDDIQDALNQQLNAEFFTAYNYLAMSAEFKSRNLTGFAHWSHVQSRLELDHAMRIYGYINDRQGNVALRQIEEPNVRWNSILEAFEIAYLHELKATTQINRLVDMTFDQRDHATNNFLQWFVSEQVEEEALASEVVDSLKLVGETGNGLFLLDHDMAERSIKVKTRT